MTPAEQAAIARDIDSLRTRVAELRRAVAATGDAPAEASSGLGSVARHLGAAALDRPWLSATLFSLAGWAVFARAVVSVQARLTDRKHR